MNDLKQTEDLIRRIITAITYHPECLEIKHTEFKGAVYWTVKAHADDQPKIIGKGGTHVRALAFLVAEIGLRSDSMYKFKLTEPEHGQRSESTKPTTPQIYSPKKAADTILEVVEAIFGKDSATIKIPTQSPYDHVYDFEIQMRDISDVPDLRTPYEDDQYEMTIIGCLGTLWRAWAKRDGVDFTISNRQ